MCALISPFEKLLMEAKSLKMFREVHRREVGTNSPKEGCIDVSEMFLKLILLPLIQGSV